MNGGGVLIVTNERDVDADRVVRELDRRGVHVVRLNTERFPAWRVELQPGQHWTVARDDRELTSDKCAGVWWRRPEPANAPDGVTPAEWEAARRQTTALLHGMQHVPGPTWVSPPVAICGAEDKALQLAVAADIGFNVPATTWTNDPAAAERQLTAHDGGVVKATATAYWEEDQTSHFVFAHAVTADDLPRPGRLAAAPLAFQQRIAPKRDVRVTVVGSATYAAVTDDASMHEPDWRLADDTTWAPYDLPDELRERCVRLVERLGLRFGGIDLLVDHDGRHWFCELNPNGEWGWLEKAGLRIADALAAELTA
ncbi:MAG TPA: hypothetical protein VF587_06025 [Solirubrobacteraceae bacterium]